MLTTQKASEQLNNEGLRYSPQDVAELIRQGVLSGSEKSGNIWLIPEQSIEDFIAQQKNIETKVQKPFPQKRLIEFLRDPIWQAIGAIAGIITIIPIIWGLMTYFSTNGNSQLSTSTSIPSTPLPIDSALLIDNFDTLDAFTWEGWQHWEVDDGKVIPNKPPGIPTPKSDRHSCPILTLKEPQPNISSIVIDFIIKPGNRNANIIIANEARIELHNKSRKIVISRGEPGNNYEKIKTPILLTNFKLEERQSMQIDFYDKRYLQVFINGESAYAAPVDLQFEIDGKIGFLGCASLVQALFEVDRFLVSSLKQ